MARVPKAPSAARRHYEPIGSAVPAAEPRVRAGGRRGALLIAAIACCATLTGCGHSKQADTYQEDTYPVAPGHLNHQTPVGKGHVGKDFWTLLASQNAEGQLCMWMSWRPYAGVQEQGCGFGSNQVNDEGRGTEPTSTTQTNDGSVLVFGPSPAGALRAVLSTPRIPGTDCRMNTVPSMTVPITHRMPAWFPPHGTGWFTAVIPLPAGDLDCVVNVRFFDGHGRTVTQPNDY